MHEGEALYVFTHWDFLIGATLLLICLVLQWYGKAPSVNAIRDFVNIWNSRGGNIIVLVGLTVYALRIAMRFIYHIVELGAAGKLDATNAIVSVALAFVTGSVYGMFAGALIKTMTGTEGGTPVPPGPPSTLTP